MVIRMTNEIDLFKWKLEAIRLKLELSRIKGIQLVGIDVERIIAAANALKFNRSEDTYIDYINVTVPDVILGLIQQFREMIAPLVDMANQYDAAIETISQLDSDVNRLVSHGAILGICIRDDDSDWANDAWRSLPEHLQDAINTEEEILDVEKIIDEETGESL